MIHYVSRPSSLRLHQLRKKRHLELLGTVTVWTPPPAKPAIFLRKCDLSSPRSEMRYSSSPIWSPLTSIVSVSLVKPSWGVIWCLGPRWRFFLNSIKDFLNSRYRECFTANVDASMIGFSWSALVGRLSKWLYHIIYMWPYLTQVGQWKALTSPGLYKGFTRKGHQKSSQEARPLTFSWKKH